MALRIVKPFDDKQMKQLDKNMERGATETQTKNLEDAKKHVQNANIKRNF